MKSNERIKGMVSAILPTYNRVEWLQERIVDVLSQTYKNWELIIVNDCSTDATPQMLDILKTRFPEDKIKIITLSKNSGCVSIPRNIGICQARGEFIAPLDDDVQSLEKKFEVLTNLLNENPNAVLAYGDRTDYWLQTNKARPVIIPYWNPLAPNGWGVDNGQIIYRASVYDNVSLQFPKRACDWELAKLIKPLGDFVHSDEMVSVYFHHEKNRSLDEGTKTKEIKPEDFKEFFNNENFKVEYN